MSNNVEVIELRHGVRVVHVRSDLPIATISLWFPWGSRFDPKGKEGLAHFVEHLLMKVTPAQPSSANMRLFLAANGIRYNAMTSMHTLHFQYEMAADQLPFALRQFVNCFLRSSVPEDFFASEKRVIRDERARRSREPERIALNLMKSTLFLDSGLAHPTLGTDTSVDAIEREDVERFVSERLRNGPKTFVVTSPGSLSDYLSYFDAIPAVSGSPEGVSDPVVSIPQRVGIVKNGSPSIAVGINFRTCGESVRDDVRALTFLSHGYLCSTASSRLLIRLREELHLTYGVQGQVGHFGDIGHFSINYSVPKERLRDSVVACEEELHRLRSGDVDHETFAAAKRARTFVLLSMSMDPLWMAKWHAANDRAGAATHTIAAEIDAVNALTPEDVKRVANTYLTPERMSLTLVGDVEEGDAADLPA